VGFATFEVKMIPTGLPEQMDLFVTVLLTIGDGYTVTSKLVGEP
jgi:hypothetical protein